MKTSPGPHLTGVAGSLDSAIALISRFNTSEGGMALSLRPLKRAVKVRHPVMR